MLKMVRFSVMFWLMVISLGLMNHPSEADFDRRIECTKEDLNKGYFLTTGGQCLIFSQNIKPESKRNWYGARHYCNKIGTRLIVLDNVTMQVAAEEYMRGEGATFWVGISNLNSHRDWRYINGEYVTPDGSYEDFYHNFPVRLENNLSTPIFYYGDNSKDAKDKKNCVYIHSQQMKGVGHIRKGLWIATFCEREMHFICEKVSPDCAGKNIQDKIVKLQPAGPDSRMV